MILELVKRPFWVDLDPYREEEKGRQNSEFIEKYSALNKGNKNIFHCSLQLDHFPIPCQ
jgi:hypothetical protein